MHKGVACEDVYFAIFEVLTAVLQSYEMLEAEESPRWICGR